MAPEVTAWRDLEAKREQREFVQFADLSGKGQSCWGRWMLRFWSRRKVKFTHFWGKKQMVEGEEES